MKRTIGIAVLFALLLGSCNFFGSLVNPIIGTWETTILGVTVSSVFNTDGTFTDTNSLGVVGVTESGTWTSDSSTITKTWPDNSTDSLSYSFNSDNSEMVLAANGGLAVTYQRQ
jgi:hypothetical protein